MKRGCNGAGERKMDGRKEGGRRRMDGWMDEWREGGRGGKIDRWMEGGRGWMDG